MPITYVHNLLTNGAFSFLETTYYNGVPQWYTFSFQTTAAVVSTYPYLRLTLNQGLRFATPIQCRSLTINSYNLTGFKYVLEQPTILNIFNIQQPSSSTLYHLDCRLQTISTVPTGPISPTVHIELHHNYTINTSIVALADITLASAPISPILSSPSSFKISNPQFVNKRARINYIGPLFLQFTTQNTVLAQSLTITLNNHRYNTGVWSTPTPSLLDPLVCLVNTVRQLCTFTLNPLTIIITNTIINTGINNLQFDT